jgi:hypothetical protein
MRYFTHNGKEKKVIIKLFNETKVEFRKRNKKQTTKTSRNKYTGKRKWRVPN